MVVGPIIAKGVTKVSHIIFGRPSKSVLDEDKTEEKVQDNGANNPLNMSEEELMQKLAAHPEIIQKMQNDPKFAQEILNNPELFKKYLNGEIKIDSTNNNPEILNSKYIVKPQQTTQGTVAPNPQNPLTSQPTSQMSAVSNNPSQSKMDLFGLGKKDKEEKAEDTTQQEQDPLEPKRTYIPSSQCTIGKTNEEEALNSEVANAISKADRVEQEALKRLGM